MRIVRRNSLGGNVNDRSDHYGYGSKKIHDYNERRHDVGSKLQIPELTRMDRTRVVVSFFPRQQETPTGCLMTAFTGWSGNQDALAQGPGRGFGWRPYMSSRLTCHSFSDWLTSQAVLSEPAVLSRVSRPASGVGPEFDLDEPIIPGAFPDRRLVGYENRGERAPERLTITEPWSTTTAVDLAGWTEVVIQEGRYVLSDVNSGHSAVVNASINWVLGGVINRPSRLDNHSDGSSDINTCGCPGPSDGNDSRFSCPSFNEVTK